MLPNRLTLAVHSDREEFDILKNSDNKLICHLGNIQVKINDTCLSKKVNKSIKKMCTFNSIGSW